MFRVLRSQQRCKLAAPTFSLSTTSSSSTLLPLIINSSRRCSSSAAQQVSAEPAMATIPTSSPPAPATTMCLLCDEEVANWMEHSATFRHTARAAVCQELCAPERNAAMLSQLFDHLRLDFELVDTAAGQRVARRQTRLSSTTKYLRDVNLLQDAILFEQFATVDLKRSSSSSSSKAGGEGDDFSSEVNVVMSDDLFLGDASEKLNQSLFVHPSFSKLVHVGERALRAELLDRCMRLFPVSSAPEVEAIVEMLCSADSVATIFDLLCFKDCLFARTVRVISHDDDRGDGGGGGGGEMIQQVVVIPTVSDYQSAAAASSNAFVKGGKQQQQLKDRTSHLHPNETVQRVLASARSTPTTHLVALSDDAKRQATLAMLGELSLFSTRDRPTSVATKADADTIVSHVLATHVIENTISELLHHVLQRLVDEGTPVWREYKESVAGLVGAATRPNALQLSVAPEPKSSLSSSSSAVSNEEDMNKKKAGGSLLLAEMLQNRHKVQKQERQQDDDDEESDYFSPGDGAAADEKKMMGDNDDVVDEARRLTFIDDILSRVSAPTPKLLWQTIVREGVKETTVPNSKNAGALLAVTVPKLTPKSMKPGVVSPAAKLAQQNQAAAAVAAAAFAAKQSKAASTVDISDVLDQDKKEQQQQQTPKPSPVSHQQQHATTPLRPAVSTTLHQQKTTTTATPIRRLNVVPTQSPNKPQQQQQQSTSSPAFKPQAGAKPITPGMAKAGGAQQQQHQQHGRFKPQQQTPIRTMQTITPATSAGGAAGAGGAKQPRRRLVPVEPAKK